MNPPHERRKVVEAIIASTIGTTIEWYDFFLYGAAAATIFPTLFFPEQPPFVAQILAFLTFTAGFLSRPFGGVIFGHIGDRYGRKATLVATLLLMGVSTVLIGCLPTAGSIGAAAPILLTLLRALQGIGVGGEWGGAVLLALEFGHRGRRGFFASWPQAGVPLGLLMATGVFTLMGQMTTREEFLDWGWRVPFWLSGLLIVVGLVIRKRIDETPLFAKLKETKQLAHAPVTETLKNHWREVLLVAGSRFCENACFYLFSVYIITYGTKELGLSQGWIQNSISLAAAIEFFTIPVYGLISDHWSRKKTYMAGCVFLMLFAWPYYALLQTRDPVWVRLAIIVSLTVGHALLYSVQASLIPELFGTRVRNTGASIGYQLAAPFAGGLSPIIAAALVEWFPGEVWPLAGYLVGMSLISLGCVVALADTSGKVLEKGDIPNMT
jgi:metabolite-proton symporter